MIEPIYFKSEKIDITPENPCRLTGMTENERHQGIHSRLEMNAMVFQQTDKHIFIFSIDTLFVNKTLKDFIREKINLCFGFTSEIDIIIIASHTHFSPSLEEKRIELGIQDIDYLSYLKNKITTLIELLFSAELYEIQLASSAGETKHITSSRRRKVRALRDYFRPFISMEPNLKGYKNEKWKLLKIYKATSDQTILGVIWNLPCHPTNFYDSKQISAEFPGKIRASIRTNQNSKNLSVVYLPGFAGDVRAYPPKRFSPNKLLRDVFQLSYPVRFYRFTNEKEYDDWIKSLVKSFWVIWNHEQKVNLENSSLNSRLVLKNIGVLGIAVDGIENIIFRKVSFGNEIGFYTMSAETVSAYSRMLDRIANENFVMFTGYTDEVFGYLPTQEQILEGGYESKDFFKPFLVTGKFSSSLELTIESCLQEINQAI
jgi:hypothetical protein